MNHQAYVRKFFERKILEDEYDDVQFKISIIHIVKKWFNLNPFKASKPDSEISRMLHQINENLDNELSKIKPGRKFIARISGRGKNSTKFKLSERAGQSLKNINFSVPLTKINLLNFVLSFGVHLQQLYNHG